MSEVVATAQQGLAGKYPPYPKYKDSGVVWLGGIPNHWISVQSRRLFSLRNTRARAGDRQLAATQKYGVIFQDIFMELEGRRVVQVQIGAEILKHVEPGDFVISMRSFQGGIEYCPYEGCVSSAYVPLTPIKWVHPDYFRYLFKSSPYIQALQSTSNLVRDGQALRFENFSLVDLPVVPIDEQRTIATFLDYETARIDRLIAQQQRLIELLKEKRQAVISHAVTKGLNPNAPMKDSGVEWLGQVPEHWEALPIKYVSWFVGTGGTPKDRDSFTDENEINWFTPGDFNGELVLDDSGKYVTKGSILSGDAKIYPAESVLIVGIGATLGKVGVCNFKFSCNQQINIVTPNRKIAVDFLAFSLLAQTEQMKQTSNASTIGIMNQEKTKGIQIAVPPVQEQTSLIIHLKKKLSDFSLTTSKAEQLIALLQERRSALISAAVTGKIDLRGWTPPAEEVAA
ncbi:restriction endonuclease subunit S [Aeromonas salmonicida]|uniref:restriction endonuclease subunit S n=1 Tax=Aeromonas salmonicida TaxID=645 RepID=UPI00223E9431|nr:restriction endonuclease subunit S [Aeromonas salmonicida]MDF8330747.1 restriction endonuclease subunit S [Aeromonas salmonicida]HEH9419319.1 restriction endonuclease subunit S [Aeromonas sobria]